MESRVLISDMEHELRRLKGLAEESLSRVDERQFFAVLGEDENSMAILVKHLAGNMRSRWRDFLISDGEKPDRHRDREFVTAEEDTRDALMERWEAAWGLLFETLAPLSDADFGKTVYIRQEALTVFQAISRQVSHYAYHVGQMVQLARHLVGPDWRSLSVPKGQSEEYNRQMVQYLTKDDKG